MEKCQALCKEKGQVPGGLSRNMPRQPRIYIKNCLYYITSQGIPGQSLFADEGDYKMYLELLKKYKEQYDFKLFSFCLMPEQLNLLVELKDGTSISVIMHDITSNYTKYFNSRYKRKGHLFRGRFRSVVVEKDAYLFNMVRYIHSRPIDLHLAKDLKEYTFSSHLLYLYNSGSQEEKTENLRNILNLDKEIQEVLDLAGKVFPEKKTYAELMASVTKEEMEGLKDKLHRTGLLGSEEFLENVKAQMKQKEKEEARHRQLVGSAILFSGLILLGGITVGAIYIQKNITSKETEIESLRTRTEELKKQQEGILTDLNGTAWTIKINAEGEGAGNEAFSDEIKFSRGKIDSQALAAEGYVSSNYTLTVRRDGTLAWETMQRNSTGDLVFWRAEEKDGKMAGVFTKRPAAGKPQDFLFTSTAYRRLK